MIERSAWLKDCPVCTSESTDYASLDTAIVKAIRDNCQVFRYILHGVRAIYPFHVTYSTLERRLTSLRKRGIIEYNNGRWSAVESVK